MSCARRFGGTGSSDWSAARSLPPASSAVRRSSASSFACFPIARRASASFSKPVEDRLHRGQIGQPVDSPPRCRGSVRAPRLSFPRPRARRPPSPRRRASRRAARRRGAQARAHRLAFHPFDRAPADLRRRPAVRPVENRQPVRGLQLRERRVELAHLEVVEVLVPDGAEVDERQVLLRRGPLGESRAAADHAGHLARLLREQARRARAAGEPRRVHARARRSAACGACRPTSRPSP